MADRRAPRHKWFEATVNPPYGQELVPLVGKLMVNFGSLELQSHQWIDHLSHDEVLVDLALETPFMRRVDLIHQMLDRENLNPELKERAKAAWQAAAELSELRNAVAHNPLVWGWHGPEKGEPDFVGIPIIRKLKGRKDGKIPSLGLDGLKRLVDEVVKVSQNIGTLLKEVTPHPPAPLSKDPEGGEGAA